MTKAAIAGAALNSNATIGKIASFMNRPRALFILRKLDRDGINYSWRPKFLFGYCLSGLELPRLRHRAAAAVPRSIRCRHYFISFRRRRSRAKINGICPIDLPEMLSQQVDEVAHFGRDIAPVGIKRVERKFKRDKLGQNRKQGARF